jgi:tricorn protease-like protein
VQPSPDLIHREVELLGVSNLASKLYKDSWSSWRQYYAIHLLFCHGSYLAEADIKMNKILDFDEDNIWSYNRTFGKMAREVLKRME